MSGDRGQRQKETEDYLSEIKLKEIFQGLLHHVITEQPSKPFDYFHQKLVEIKTEMETAKIDIGSTTFLTEVQSSQQQTRMSPR